MNARADVRLAALADEHVELREGLFGALDALVAGDAAAARARFDDFAARLLAHASAEEQHLLPLFTARGLESVGCTAAILRADHAKLRRALGEARALLARTPDAPAPRARVETVLALRGLVELLAHHDQRERAGFFPALDQALSAAERAALYASCARSQSSA